MYKQTQSFAQRKNESTQMLNRYPNRVPIIIEPKGNAPKIDKRKFMTPRDLTIGQLIFVVRKRLNFNSQQALFLFIDEKTLATPSSQIGHIYDRFKDEDSFLYIFYSLENTFG